jgi:hypothetical protein
MKERSMSGFASRREVLKAMGAGAAWLTVGKYLTRSSRGEDVRGSRPNIVVILADDMGFSDIGCYGGEVKTPNIDALGTLGVKFTSMYNCAVLSDAGVLADGFVSAPGGRGAPGGGHRFAGLPDVAER